MSSPLILSFFLSLSVLCLLPSGVVGHAKLVSPIAWNPNPSKTQICGVAAGQNNPANFKVTNIPGQSFTIQWTVVVGDGTGPISASIDPTAKNNPALSDFTVQLQSVDTNNPSAVSPTPYSIKFQIPANTVCTGPNGICTLRVVSTSNWVACATITLGTTTNAPTAAPTTKAPTTKAPTNPPTGTSTSSSSTTITPTTIAPTATPTTAIPAPPVLADNFVPYPASSNPCAIATGLVTCSMINGQNVQLMGPSLAVLDANVQDEINLALTNPAVLTTPNVAGCQKAFTDLICAQSFPSCSATTTSVCRSTCVIVNNLCAPNTTAYADGTSHASLYACDNTALGFTATISDTTGNCPTTTPTPTTPSTTQKPQGGTNDGMIIHVPIILVSLTMVLAWIIPKL